MSRQSLVCLLLLGALCAPAQALTSREDLYKWCTQGSSVAVGRCLGYLLAAEDALSVDDIEGIRACLPRDITLQIQHRSVMEWLGRHPDATANSAIGLIARAWAEAFPCASAAAAASGPLK
jgi:hypothetical protein